MEDYHSRSNQYCVAQEKTHITSAHALGTTVGHHIQQSSEKSRM